MARLFVTANSTNANNSNAVLKDYPFTVMGWFKCASNPATNGMEIFLIYNSGNSSLDNIGVSVQQTTAVLGGFVSTSGGSYHAVITGSSITAGAWHSFAYVGVSSTSRIIYLDGGSPATDTNGSTFGLSQNTTEIGAFITSACFDGSLAEICCWNAALTAGEVAAFNAGARAHQIRPASIVGYWPLDGLSSPEPDLSGSAHNMTLTGSPAQANGPPISVFTRRQPLSTISVASSFIPAWAVPSNKISSGGYAT
jgi:hypothetical protein